MNRLRILFFMLIYFTQPLLCGNLPISKQAIYINVDANGNILLSSTGIYHSGKGSKARRKNDISKNGVEMATNDAKRSAIYHLIFSTDNPLINTTEEIQR